jgi:hypothetical protein
MMFVGKVTTMLHHANNLLSQVAEAQQRRDDQLFDLFDTMSTTLRLACKTDEIGFLDPCRDIVLDVAKKAEECSSFVRKYMQNPNFRLFLYPFHRVRLPTSLF